MRLSQIDFVGPCLTYEIDFVGPARASRHGSGADNGTQWVLLREN